MRPWVLTRLLQGRGGGVRCVVRGASPGGLPSHPMAAPPPCVMGNAGPPQGCAEQGDWRHLEPSSAAAGPCPGGKCWHLASPCPLSQNVQAGAASLALDSQCFHGETEAQGGAGALDLKGMASAGFPVCHRQLRVPCFHLRLNDLQWSSEQNSSGGIGKMGGLGAASETDEHPHPCTRQSQLPEGSR